MEETRSAEFQILQNYYQLFVLSGALNLQQRKAGISHI